MTRGEGSILGCVWPTGGGLAPGMGHMVSGGGSASLAMGVPAGLTLPLLGRVFVPSHTSRVLVQVLGCRAGNRSAASCPLWLKVRAKAPPLHNSTALDCRERAPCQLALELPLWQHWYYVLLEKALGVPGPIHFQLTVQLTGESRGAGPWGGWRGPWLSG